MKRYTFIYAHARAPLSTTHYYQPLIGGTTAMSKNATTDAAIELLGKGYKQSEVATILQVSDSAVSQIATNHAGRIRELSAEKAVVAKCIDDDIDELQATILSSLKERVAYEADPLKLTKMFGVLNGAKRRSTATDVQDNNDIARVQLPQHLRQSVTFVQNTHNEITVVNGRSLETASQDRVKDLLERRSTNNGLRSQHAPLAAEDFEIETEDSE